MLLKKLAYIGSTDATAEVSKAAAVEEEIEGAEDETEDDPDESEEPERSSLVFLTGAPFLEPMENDRAPICAFLDLSRIWSSGRVTATFFSTIVDEEEDDEKEEVDMGAEEGSVEENETPTASAE